MKNAMEYKGFYGSVCYNDDDGVFHGKIEYINSLVNFEGTDVNSLRASFEESVEDYLQLCEDEGKEPDKPLKGSFNVRTGCDLHRKAAIFAKENDISLNMLVSNALRSYISENRTDV